MPDETALPDGTYDAFIIDATAADQPSLDGAVAIALDLTIVSGEHKGEVLTVTAAGLAHTDVELMGMPATLTVTDGNPAVRIDG